MEKKKIKDLAKGEYFILNPIEEPPNASQVWVRGEWDGIPCIKTGRLFTPRS